MLNKQKIKLSNRDINIRIPIGTSNNFTGYQQEINKLTNFNALNIANPVEDEEIRRFNYLSDNIFDIRFAFHVPTSNTFMASLTQAGFETNEINNGNRGVQNSFYIVDFYDSFDRYSQNKLFSNHSSKIITRNLNVSVDSSIYRLNPNSQFYYINVPVWFIDTIESDEMNSVIIYARFLFYNAKTGTVFSFYNADNNLLTTDERYYVRTELNLTNFTWRFLSPSITSQNTVQLREIERNRNQKFNEKVNNTVDSLNEEEIIAPDGNTFSDEFGIYVTT